jgi:hypothetical protein
MSKNITSFEDFSREEKNSKTSEMNESFWTAIFGNPTVKGAAEDHMRKSGFSHTGKDEDNYIMFQGQKFYQDSIEYDDYHSTKPLPRIEGGKLIIANPAWRE